DETYHPFGQLQESLPFPGCNGHVRKFTAKERDLESGLDYFGARFYDSLTGRFLSPDPLLASARADSPQSWNRYPYPWSFNPKFPKGASRNQIRDSIL
ncbi:MAG TPA: RHS repeat-associated core domain-containing protein, partial [Acidobacteriota bacterium]|nr:RHS repeat-associated core domain-containing protein [Acidobacteriota bacterium]